MQEPAPVRGGQGGDRLLTAGKRILGAGRIRADGMQHFVPQFGRAGAADGAAQHFVIRRMPSQVIGQGRADAEHRRQPVAEVLLGTERSAQGRWISRGG